MRFESFLRLHTRSVLTALSLMVVAAVAHGTDSYNAASKQLTVPSVTIGSATYSNMIVTVGAIVSGPTGVAPIGNGDVYNPANNQLIVRAVNVGGIIRYNAVVTVGTLVSVGGVTGADTYNAALHELTIPAVLVDGTVYTNVLITVGSILSTGGGMPQNSVDIYNAANHQLTIEAVQLGSTVYTNPVVTPGSIKSVGGQMPTESLLYSFGPPAGTATDSQTPYAGLIQASDGNFYGTASAGGAKGAGTIFRVTPKGDESIVYSFGANGAGDGSLPAGNLVQGSDGALYGTTLSGGASGAGTVFKVTPQGVESVLYSFTGGNDGGNPLSNLVLDGAGNLYGTASAGGTHSLGNVFKLTPQGVETVLWSFSGSDGSAPAAGLTIGNDGNFYGTTQNGGAHGSGAIFRVTPTGTMTTMHSFAGGTDGIFGYAGLTLGSDGNFYGTTINGGIHEGGIVFRMTPAGTVSTVYSFTGESSFTGNRDGAFPYGNLVEDHNGNFFGTTLEGGNYNGGIVFEITPAGTELNLHAFGGPGVVAGTTDGAGLQCELALGTEGKLYGLTLGGGVNQYGTMFSLTVAL